MIPKRVGGFIDYPRKSNRPRPHKLRCKGTDKKQNGKAICNFCCVFKAIIYYFDPRTNAYRTIHYMATIQETVFRGAGGTGTEYWTGLVLTAEEK